MFPYSRMRSLTVGKDTAGQMEDLVWHVQQVLCVRLCSKDRVPSSKDRVPSSKDRVPTQRAKWRTLFGMSSRYCVCVCVVKIECLVSTVHHTNDDVMMMR